MRLQTRAGISLRCWEVHEMDLTAPVQTGYGMWAPVVWLVAFVAAVVIVYLLWKTGESSYKKGTELERPYLSGNVEPEKGAVHIRASNLYWGFLQALKGYYDVLVPIHTGVLTDYMIWFVAVTALVLVIVGVLS
jgi:hypothetical protein